MPMTGRVIDSVTSPFIMITGRPLIRRLLLQMRRVAGLGQCGHGQLDRRWVSQGAQARRTNADLFHFHCTC